jgi:competence protein ComEC
MVPVGIFLLIRPNDNFPEERQKRARKALVLSGVILFALLVACPWLLPLRNTRINFFDVGQGDAAFIQQTNGTDLLIDAGPDRTILSRLGTSMPYFDRTIERVVLTHQHVDHVNGFFAVLEKYEIKEVWVSQNEKNNEALSDLLGEFSVKGAKVRVVSVGEGDQFGDVGISVLSPQQQNTQLDPNNSSVVLKISTGNLRLLFMGDAGKTIETKLLASNPKDLAADILKIGHHGSKSATSKEFLDAVTPRFAIISAGAKNQYGHPSPETLETIKKSGAKILRTDTCGSIKFDVIPNKSVIFHAQCKD